MAPDNDIEFNPDGYSCNFDSQIGDSLHPDLAKKQKHEIDFAVSWYKDATPDLSAFLTAIKQQRRSHLAAARRRVARGAVRHPQNITQSSSSCRGDR